MDRDYGFDDGIQRLLQLSVSHVGRVSQILSSAIPCYQNNRLLLPDSLFQSEGKCVHVLKDTDSDAPGPVSGHQLHMHEI